MPHESRENQTWEPFKFRCESALNTIMNTIRSSPVWEEVSMIIVFRENMTLNPVIGFKGLGLFLNQVNSLIAMIIHTRKTRKSNDIRKFLNLFKGVRLQI